MLGNSLGTVASLTGPRCAALDRSAAGRRTPALLHGRNPTKKAGRPQPVFHRFFWTIAGGTSGVAAARLTRRRLRSRVALGRPRRNL